ncbi:MAG: nuclear transport factor 2 family protein [Bacteroidota bacterium]
MKKVQLLLLFMAIIFASQACSTTESETTATEPEKEVAEEKVEISNKEKAVALLESLETGDQTPISYINPAKYIQHNLGVADGLEGFGMVMKNAPEGGFKAKVVRAFEDGDYVFTHTVYDFFGPKVGFDIFRFENGLIVEHWDNLIELAPKNPSGRSQTDGETKSSQMEKTEDNKTIVGDFINTILIKGEFDKIGNYFDGDNYLQHNPAVADGLSGLNKALEEMAKNNVQMIYTTNHKVLGEGNFVLAVSEGTFGGQHTSYYDLFRMENGKIAEHWDVIETIAPEDKRMNNNGKFNF